MNFDKPCPNSFAVSLKLMIHDNYLPGIVFCLCNSVGDPCLSLACREYYDELFFVYSVHDGRDWKKLRVATAIKYNEYYDVLLEYGNNNSLTVESTTVKFDNLCLLTKNKLYLVLGDSYDAHDDICMSATLYDFTVMDENNSVVWYIQNFEFDECRGNQIYNIEFVIAPNYELKHKICDVLKGQHDYVKSGTRSRIFTHNNKTYKIKGAGYKDTYPLLRIFKSGNKSPYYDFDGNYYYDKSNNCNANYGSMTMQQVTNEYHISNYLLNNGFNTYCPQAYGSYNINNKIKGHFICLEIFDIDDDTRRIPALIKNNNLPSEYDSYMALATEYGEVLRKLHDMHVVMHHANMFVINTSICCGDWHTAKIEKFNYSYLSRALYMLYDINVYIVHNMHFEKFGNNLAALIISAYLGFNVSKNDLIEFNKYISFIIFGNNDMNYYERVKYLQNNKISNEVLEYAERL